MRVETHAERRRNALRCPAGHTECCRCVRSAGIGTACKRAFGDGRDMHPHCRRAAARARRPGMRVVGSRAPLPAMAAWRAPSSAAAGRKGADSGALQRCRPPSQVLRGRPATHMPARRGTGGAASTAAQMTRSGLRPHAGDAAARHAYVWRRCTCSAASVSRSSHARRRAVTGHTCAGLRRLPPDPVERRLAAHTARAGRNCASLRVKRINGRRGAALEQLDVLRIPTADDVLG